MSKDPSPSCASQMTAPDVKSADVIDRMRRTGRLAGDVLAQVGAALVMGSAIRGMHYTGMAAAGFPEGTLCLSADALGGDNLGALVIAATVVLLSITLVTSIIDARLQAHANRLANRLELTNRELQEANDELQRLAFNDPLTGVPNLARFDDRLQHALALASRRPDRRIAVLFIDLDGFKPVNDSWGHAVGDQLLRQVAGRLRALCRATDTLARVGGDEFVLLLEDLDDAVQAEVLARRLLNAVGRPFEVERRAFGEDESFAVRVALAFADFEAVAAFAVFVEIAAFADF